MSFVIHTVRLPRTSSACVACHDRRLTPKLRIRQRQNGPLAPDLLENFGVIGLRNCRRPRLEFLPLFLLGYPMFSEPDRTDAGASPAVPRKAI